MAVAVGTAKLCPDALLVLLATILVPPDQTVTSNCHFKDDRYRGGNNESKAPDHSGIGTIWTARAVAPLERARTLCILATTTCVTVTPGVSHSPSLSETT